MFDFAQILELMKIEPGHGMLQSVLLFMIWVQSRGLRKDVASLHSFFDEASSKTDKRFKEFEFRLAILEGGKKNG